MTELQKAELNILEYFIDICNKLNLKYFMICGSALGAVKYNGFIPWDDDIDVALKREDYEIFCANAQNMLPPNIFLQNYKTEPNFPHIYSKLRNSDTTFIEKSAENLDINHGIYIDIFPLDGYPRNRLVQGIFEFKKRIYESMLLSAFNIPRSVRSSILHNVYNFFGVKKHIKTITSRYDRMIKKYKIENSTIIANHGNWQGKLEYATKEQYGSGTIKKFESVNVRIPEKYDEYLTQKYGSWMEELPDDKRIGHHYYIACDTKVSYVKFIGGKVNEK